MDKYLEDIKNLVLEYKAKLIIIGLGIIFLVSGYMFLTKSNENQTTDVKQKISSPKEVIKSKEEKQTKASIDEQIYVDVKGAVLNPGIYAANKMMRSSDLIKMAGGFNQNADSNHVNLAKKVNDQEILYVPYNGEVSGLPDVNLKTSENVESASDTPSSQPNQTSKTNINSADLTKLQSINGVGQKKAEKIIDYRNQNGLFKTVDDLKNVPGFGQKTVETLKASLAV
ncbi:helix-hairpin-helix domain-containing protein [Fructilactobacillus vespulae]|uniref:helix-hairpin-helix domain-containing protein n=1 Tax=Fructilactobacillus vespulae TaxID=1249630 RepID=UPI0039B694C4